MQGFYPFDSKKVRTSWAQWSTSRGVIGSAKLLRIGQWPKPRTLLGLSLLPRVATSTLGFDAASVISK